MTGDVAQREHSDPTASWDSLLDDHRHDWAERVLAGWTVIDLAEADDPAQELAAAEEGTAFVWLHGYAGAVAGDRVAAALAAAGERGAPIVIGLEADDEGRGQRDAESLLERLDGSRVVAQELAAGSLIGASPDEPRARRRSTHVLVCANLEPGAADARLDAAAEPLISGYVAWLEQANDRLRTANARLGRAHLGQHDAAAAAFVSRRIELEERVAELEQQLAEQRDLADAHLRMLVEAQEDKVNTLSAPRYRVVDSIREIAVNLPGVRAIVGRRSRRVSDRWDRG